MDSYKDLTNNNITPGIRNANYEDENSLVQYETNDELINLFQEPEKGIPPLESFNSLIEYSEYKGLENISGTSLASIIHCCFAAIISNGEEYAYKSFWIINEILNNKPDLFTEISQDEIDFLLIFVGQRQPNYIFSQMLGVLEILLNNGRVSIDDSLFETLINIFLRNDEDGVMSRKGILGLLKSNLIKNNEICKNLITFVNVIFDSLNINQLENSINILQTINDIFNKFQDFQITPQKANKLLPFTLIPIVHTCVLAFDIIRRCLTFPPNIDVFIECGLINIINNNKIFNHSEVSLRIYGILSLVSEYSREYCELCLKTMFICIHRNDNMPFSSKLELYKVALYALRWKLVDQSSLIYELFLNHIIENGTDIPNDILFLSLETLQWFDLSECDPELFNTIRDILDDTENEDIENICKEILKNEEED